MELLLLLQLRVAVDQQRRVLAVRQALLVQRLQVLRQLRHALRVQELANYVRRLHEADGVNVPTLNAHRLHHSLIAFSFSSWSYR